MSNKTKNSDSSIEISDRSGEPFTAVWNWFLDRNDLSGKEKLVWIVLKSYAGYQEIRPSIKSISKRASISVSTIRRTLTKLARKGFVCIDRRQGPDGGSIPNRYTLLPAKSIRTADKASAGGCHHDIPSCHIESTGGVTLAPNINRYYKNKQKRTTTLAPHNPKPDPGQQKRLVCGRVFLEKMLSGTLFASADTVRIARAADKYSFTDDEVAVVVDFLDQQYRKSKRPIENPTALIVTALKERVEVSESYIPRLQREAEMKRSAAAVCKKNEQEINIDQAVNEAYAIAETTLSSLTDTQREELFEEAGSKLHYSLRSSSVALRSFALEILIAKAKLCDGPIESQNLVESLIHSRRE